MSTSWLLPATPVCLAGRLLLLVNQRNIGMQMARWLCPAAPSFGAQGANTRAAGWSCRGASFPRHLIMHLDTSRSTEALICRLLEFTAGLLSCQPFPWPRQQHMIT